MINSLLILVGKFICIVSRLLNLGNGSTWPGQIALSINKNFIKDLFKNSKVKINLIVGTNGKTTTGKLIQSILEKNGKRVFQNAAGANLLNGIASSLVLHSTVVGRLNYDFANFEIDENTLPLILKEINNPDFIIILNLFRDQLDRYGEVNTISSKWLEALKNLDKKTTFILNADDPQIAYLGTHPKGVNVRYFGINFRHGTNETQHASDSSYCPNCGKKLIYKSVYFSHLGDWICKKCGFEHPKKTFISSAICSLTGSYNEYNTSAAVLLAMLNNVDNRTIEQSLKDFKPPFGRQEILDINGKKAQIFLSKNPTSFNESLRTVVELGGKNLLIVLNDRIPDGRDVSWIWDVDIEEYASNFKNIFVSGDRAYDMALRLKYSSETQNSKVKNQNYNSKFKIYENLKDAIWESLKLTSKNETLYILPTYSAMLKVRKILTGRKIL